MRLRSTSLILAFCLFLLAFSAAPLAFSQATASASGLIQAPSSADGMYKFSLLTPGDYPVRFTATGFKTADIASASINVTGTAGLNQAQAGEPAPATPPPAS